MESNLSAGAYQGARFPRVLETVLLPAHSACLALALSVVLLFSVPATPLSAGETERVLGSEDCPVLPLMLDAPPQAISCKPAPYPEEWKTQGISGAVLLYYVINAEGKAVRVRVLSSTDHRFDEMCVATAKAWQFQPPQFEGRAVACSVVQPVAYASTPEERKRLVGVLQSQASFADTQLENHPRAISTVDPEYPKNESRTLTLGVSAVVVVDEEGCVREASVSGKDLPHAFRIEILRSLLKWRFEKGMKNGAAVPWRAEVTYLINPRGPDGKLLNPPSPLDKPLIITMSSILPRKEKK